MKAKSWYLMGLLSFFSFLNGCGAMSKDASKVTNFRWYAVATAPRDYPMKVISGTFYFKGENSGIGIPSGGTIHTGWGKSASVYVGDCPVLSTHGVVKILLFTPQCPLWLADGIPCL